MKGLTLARRYPKPYLRASGDVDLFVDSGLRGLRFVGFLDDVQRAVNKEVDLRDVTHVQPGSVIDKEIRETGVLLYEK